MKTVLAHIVTIGKVLGAFSIAIGGVLWLDSRFDAQTDNKDAMFDSIAEVKQMVEYNNIEIGFLAERQEAFQDTLEKFENEHKKQGENIESLGWAIRNIENFTPEQMEEILNRELKKNVSLRPDLDYDFPLWWIVQPSTDLILSKAN